MPGEGRTSITVKDATFEDLKADKPEGVTWDYYLTRLADHRLVDAEPATVDGGGGRE